MQMKKTAVKGHTAKHTATRKHQHHAVKHHPTHKAATATAAAHHVHTVAKHPHHAKARGLAIGAEVACCTAEGLAASLRLAGAAVSAADVLALYWLTADNPDAGAPILATLRAAERYGLAGYRPRFTPAAPDAGGVLLLGLDLPAGPHTVLAEPRGWRTWGDLYDPADLPGAVAEEAWVITWQ